MGIAALLSLTLLSLSSYRRFQRVREGLVDGLLEERKHFLVVKDHVDEGEGLLRAWNEEGGIEDNTALHHVAQIDLEEAETFHLTLSQEGVVTLSANLAE